MLKTNKLKAKNKQKIELIRTFEKNIIEYEK